MAIGAIGVGGADPNSVQGSLAGAAGGGGSVSQSSSGTGIVPGMMDLYNQTLGLNAQNYQNILGAYGQGSQAMQASLPGIYQGYGNLGSQIGKTLGQGGDWGVATPAAQAIGQAFAQQQGSSQQQMINAGLGNTTALSNATNQNTLFAGQAYGGLGAQLAQTYAGYQAQTGLAGLGAQMQGLGMQTGLAQNEGQTLASQKQALPNVLGSFGQSTSIGAQNAASHYAGGGGVMGGNPNGGGNFLPMEHGGGNDYYRNGPIQAAPSTGYNPYIGTPPKFGGGNGSAVNGSAVPDTMNIPPGGGPFPPTGTDPGTEQLGLDEGDSI